MDMMSIATDNAAAALVFDQRAEPYLAWVAASRGVRPQHDAQSARLHNYTGEVQACSGSNRFSVLRS
ncbi:hypothetical protein SBC2_84100 (plasmid) [Caballeronia sp. SBC2]|nr:hypothetical protein SBC2_84100 [Caballeronia sp. SBC2]